MMTRIVLVAACCILMLQGCATLFQGTGTGVEFSTEPAGATVYVNGFPRGTTPTRIKLETKKTYQIEFKKDGYDTISYTITNHVGAGWVILDIIGGLIPVVVDAATGAWYELDQTAVNAILEQQ